ncbi:MAG: HAD-IA family hydrolase [Pirellulaceae bacterium]
MTDSDEIDNSHPPPRMVLLDAFGTVIRPQPSVAAAYHAVGLKHGVQVSQGEIERRFREAILRHSVRNFAQNLPTHDSASGPLPADKTASTEETLLATDPHNERQRWRAIVSHVFRAPTDLIESIFHDLWEYFAQPSSWRPFDDVAPLVRELQRRGYEVGVASNFDDRLPPIIEHYFARFELLVFVSSELGSVKPSRQFFTEIESRTGLSPAELLLVGDDEENDYHAPRAAGWQACLVDRDPAKTGNPRGEISPLDVVGDLCDLLQRLPMRS